MITKDTRLLGSDGSILRVLRVEDEDISKTDVAQIVPVVTFCGTKTYRDAQSRSRATLDNVINAIRAGKMQIVTTKPDQSEVETGTGISSWRPEIVDTIIAYKED